MSCNTTENTFIRDYNTVLGSRLPLSGSLEAPAGTPMNLTGYEFRLEVCKNKDFIDTTIPDSIGTISSNTYLFNVDFSSPYTIGTYYYRISMKDSLGKLLPEALRAGRFIVTQ